MEIGERGKQRVKPYLKRVGRAGEQAHGILLMNKKNNALTLF